MNDQLNHFQRTYDAEVGESRRRYAKLKRFDWYSSTNIKAMDYVEHEYENAVEITMRKEQFHKLVEKEYYTDKNSREQDYNYRLVNQMRADELVRMDNLSVKLAWDKYKMLLELARK